MMQMAVKARLRHIALGISAGRPACDWRCIHHANVGTRATATRRRKMLTGSFMSSRLPAIALEEARQHSIHQSFLERDSRENIREGAETRTRYQKPDPIDTAEEVLKYEGLPLSVLWQLPRIRAPEQHRQRRGDIECEAPAERGALADAANNQADGPSERLTEAETREGDVSALAGGEGVGDDAEGGGEAHGDGDALEAAEDNELAAGLGEAGGEDEDAQEEAAEDVDGTVADVVGYGAGEEEGAAAGEARWYIRIAWRHRS